MSNVINPNQLGPNYLPQDPGVPTSDGAAGTGQVRTPAPVADGGSPSPDSLTPSASTPQLAAPLPAAQTQNQPANYTAALASAKDKLNAAATAGLDSPLNSSILMAESNKINKTGDDLTSGRSADQKKEIVQKQADSILESTSASTKHGCKVKHTNTQENVAKMQRLGFSAAQAKAMTRILEDGRSPDSVKQKLAFELAALGMTGAGQANTTALSSNSAQVKTSLTNFANQEAKKFGALNGGAAVSAALLNPVGAIAVSGATLAVMKSSGNVFDNTVKDRATFADGSQPQGLNNLATGQGAPAAGSGGSIENPVSVSPNVDVANGVASGNHAIDSNLVSATLKNALPALG